MHTRWKLLQGFICLLTAAACTRIGPVAAPGGGDAELRVYAPPEANSFTLIDGLTLAVENESAHEIMFLPENAVALFLKEGDEWKPVENLVSNPVPRKIILSPRDVVDSNAMVVSVIPDVPRSNPVLIRVEILGIDQATQQQVRAATEATLTP